MAAHHSLRVTGGWLGGREGRDRPAGRRLTSDWARRITVTDPAHVTIAGTLRRAYQSPRLGADHDDLGRDLTDYDRAFGLDSR